MKIRLNLKDMKISRKLLAGFLAVSAISTGIAGIGIAGLLHSRTTMDGMQMRMDSLPVITDVLTSMSSVQSASRDAVLNCQNQDVFEADAAAFDKYNQLYKDSDAKLYATLTTDEWKQKLSQARKDYEANFEPQIKQVLDDAKAGNLTEANNLLQTSHTEENKIFDVYTAFMAYRMQVAQTQHEADVAMSTAILIALLVFAAAGIAASVLLGIRISRSIGKPLGELADCAARFSQGDINAHSDYESGNEIGVLAKSLNAAFASLRGIVKEIAEVLLGISEGKCDFEPIREYRKDFKPISDALNVILVNLNRIFRNVMNSSEQVAGGAKQIADGSQELAQGATEQASSVEELSASIGEVSDKVRKNSQQVSSMAASMEAASREVEESDRRMKSMLTAMGEIANASNKIGEIISVIDNIAFQTNILALNAAVEAARAGEAGRGFAVVADEVRSLAGKSAEAAKQTSDLIGNSAEKVKEGLSLADGTAKALSSIAGQVEEIDQIIHEIEQSSNAQAASITQITQGVEQVSSVIQTNSATAEESAAASEELSAQARSLKQEIDWIKLRT